MFKSDNLTSPEMTGIVDALVGMVTFALFPGSALLHQLEVVCQSEVVPTQSTVSETVTEMVFQMQPVPVSTTIL